VSEPTGEARYVYGIVRAREGDSVAAPPLGGAARGVEIVRVGDLGALVSRAPPVPVKATRANLLAHTDVLQEALQSGAVLPMSFGIVMPDEEAVREDLLRASYEKLRSALDEIDDKVEIDIKGFYREDVVLREIVEENPQIARLRGATLRASEDAGYYARIELGQRVANALAQKREADVRRVVSALRAFAVADVTESELPERVALSAAFLVERGRLPAFDRAVEGLVDEFGERMQLKYLGPLPAYRFVDVKLAPAGGGR
jgi:hypothetical protein